MTGAQEESIQTSRPEFARSVQLETRSGTHILVERAQQANWRELKDFFRHLSPDDLRYRFPSSLKEPSDAEVTSMVQEGASMTFLARDVRDGQLLAVATLTRGGSDHDAEVALSTRPDRKHEGVSWTLLEHVLAVAKADGFEAVWSLESGDNREAINLEREMGFVVRLNRADPVEVLANKRLAD